MVPNDVTLVDPDPEVDLLTVDVRVPVVLPEVDLEGVVVRVVVVVPEEVLVLRAVTEVDAVLVPDELEVIEADAVVLELDDTDVDAEDDCVDECDPEGDSVLTPLADALTVAGPVGVPVPTALRVDVRLFDAVDAAEPEIVILGLLDPLGLPVLERDTLTERVGLPLAVPVLLTVEVVVELPVPVVVRLTLFVAVPVTVLVGVLEPCVVRDELAVEVVEGESSGLALADLDVRAVTDVVTVMLDLELELELFDTDTDEVPVTEVVDDCDIRDDADAERVEEGVLAAVGAEVPVLLAVVDVLIVLVAVVVLDARKLKDPLAVVEADLDRTDVEDTVSVVRAVEDVDADADVLREGRDVEEASMLDVDVLLGGGLNVGVEDGVVELLRLAVALRIPLAVEVVEGLELPEDVDDVERVLVSKAERDDVVVADADRDRRDVAVTSAELVEVRVALAEDEPERVAVVLLDEVVLAVAVRVGKIVAVVQEVADGVLDGGIDRVLLGVCRVVIDGRDD